MAKRVAEFLKVSFEQFAEGYRDSFGECDEKLIREVYDSFDGRCLDMVTFVKIATDWVLKCYPRSGLGFKYRLQLNNTVGIIDSDYYMSDNEGHIFAKITNDSKEGKSVNIPAGTGFMQGIFVEYGITVDDEVTEARNGGFGSTTNR